MIKWIFGETLSMFFLKVNKENSDPRPQGRFIKELL